MSKFIPGMKLSEKFFNEIVRDLMKKKFLGLKYAAGLFDYGSEVLGFDSERSTDHDWGPRVLIFISPEDIKKKKIILNYLNKNRPQIFCGYSTYFSESYATDIPITGNSKTKSKRRRNDLPSCFEIYTIESFFKKHLLWDIKKKITALDWLTFPEQKLRALRSGKIFYDKLGLIRIKSKLNYFPKDIWLYMLSSEWTKLRQEEPFVGRTGEAEDELGSEIISARIVHTIMKLCFLMEKEYAPYSKWFGTAFSKLKCAKKMSTVLNEVFTSENWKERQFCLSKAYKLVAQMHNDLRLTEPQPTDVSEFYSRPYLVIRAGKFANQLIMQIKDPVVKKIPSLIGSVNQFTNSVDLLGNERLLNKMKVLYKKGI